MFVFVVQMFFLAHFGMDAKDGNGSLLPKCYHIVCESKKHMPQSSQASEIKDTEHEPTAGTSKTWILSNTDTVTL
jgi:hypothetical protein